MVDIVSFRKGNKIRLHISSSNCFKYTVNLSDGGPMYVEREGLVATNSLYHDAARPSMLLLPAHILATFNLPQKAQRSQRKTQEIKHLIKKAAQRIQRALGVIKYVFICANKGVIPRARGGLRALQKVSMFSIIKKYKNDPFFVCFVSLWRVFFFRCVTIWFSI